MFDGSGVWLCSGASFCSLREFGCEDSGIWLSGFGCLVVFGCLVTRLRVFWMLEVRVSGCFRVLLFMSGRERYSG